MNKTIKTLLIIASILIILFIGGRYIFYSFLKKAYGRCKVEVTAEYISSSCGFINGISIEKIKVDSIGPGNYPVKYTSQYITTCYIEHPASQPPVPPKKIKFDEEGKYNWREKTINVHFIHAGLRREAIDSTERQMQGIGLEKFKTCPLKIEKEQWYFFNDSDPRTTGIFFYIDREGKQHQYVLDSGVSPI